MITRCVVQSAHYVCALTIGVGDLRSHIAVVVVVSGKHAKEILALKVGSGEYVLEGVFEAVIVNASHSVVVEIVAERQGEPSTNFPCKVVHAFGCSLLCSSGKGGLV